jgi:hypothetical protein
MLSTVAFNLIGIEIYLTTKANYGTVAPQKSSETVLGDGRYDGFAANDHGKAGRVQLTVVQSAVSEQDANGRLLAIRCQVAKLTIVHHPSV